MSVPVGYFLLGKTDFKNILITQAFELRVECFVFSQSPSYSLLVALQAFYEME